MLERNEPLGGLNRGFTVLEPRLQGENLSWVEGSLAYPSQLFHISFKNLGELIT